MKLRQFIRDEGTHEGKQCQGLKPLGLQPALVKIKHTGLCFYF